MSKLYLIYTLLISMFLCGCADSVTEYEYHDYRENFAVSSSVVLPMVADTEGGIVEIPIEANEYVVWIAATKNAASALICEVLNPQNVGSANLRVNVYDYAGSSLQTATITVKGYYNRVLFGEFDVTIQQQ